MTQVGLVGLRLGATLAARVASRRDDVDRLCLWDPVVLGEVALLDLERTAADVAFHGAQTPDSMSTNDERTILGFPRATNWRRTSRVLSWRRPCRRRRFAR